MERRNILPGTGRGTSRRLVEGGGYKRCDRVGHGVDISHHPPRGNPNDPIALFP